MLEVFSRYPLKRAYNNAGKRLSELFRVEAFALVLAFHDLGKHLPPGYIGNLPAGKEKAKQHERTVRIFEKYKDELGLAEKETEIARFLIDGDRFGTYFRSVFKGARLATFPEDHTTAHVSLDGRPLVVKKDVEAAYRSGRLEYSAYLMLVKGWSEYVSSFEISQVEVARVAQVSAQDFLQAAGVLGISPLILLNLQILYFQCDVRAYTADAKGGTPSLDYLLKRNESALNFNDPQYLFSMEKRRFIFSDRYEAAYEAFERVVAKAEKQLF